MHKRGISGVIVALILVLLALVAVGILWFVITNILSEGSEGISLRRLFVDLEIKKVILAEDNITIIIKKTGKEDIVGIAFIISDGENSETIKKPTDIQQLGERTFILIPEEISIDSIEKISVAPIFKLESGEEELGGIVDIWVRTNGATNGGGQVGGTCTNGETQLCLYQDGVCYGSEQTCTGETWPGCDYSGISGYESTEITCDDGLDNDCDGNTDMADTDCEGECVPNLTACLGRECGDVANGTCGTISCGDCQIIYGSGYTCNATGQCEIETFVNSGTIYSVWPSGAVKYFDSDYLPKDFEGYEYMAHYIKFPGTDENCIVLKLISYIPENDRSYGWLDEVALIDSGDNYEIWETEEGCNL